MTRVSVIRALGVPLLLAAAAACSALRKEPCTRIAEASAAGDHSIAPEVRAVLDGIASTGQVTDFCAAEAAVYAAASLDLRENLPAIRRIARLDSKSKVEEDLAGAALHSLSLFEDEEAVPIARELLNRSAPMAGTAAMVLSAMKDWQSTGAVLDRLRRETDLVANYSMVWLTLDFLARSPERPAGACEVLGEHLRPFDSRTDLKNPTMKQVIDTRAALLVRYGCPVVSKDSQ